MKTNAPSNLNFTALPKDYPGLVRLYPPRPIRDHVDEQNVEEIVFAMAGFTLTRDQDDYLAIMSDLLSAYEQTNYPDPPDKSTPLQRLKALMEFSQTTSSKLGDIIGSRPSASMVLRGKRQPSKAHVRKRAAHFHLQADYFL